VRALAGVLLALLALPAEAQVTNPSRIELKDEGTSKGRIFSLDCIGAELICAATNGVATITHAPALVPFARGGTGLSTAADDTTLVSSGSAWAASALPNCTDTTGNHLNYTAASNAFSCGTSSGGVTASSSVTWAGTHSFIDNNLSIIGSVDATKIAKFEVDGITTGTTRTYTLPNVAGGTVILTNSASFPGGGSSSVDIGQGSYLGVGGISLGGGISNLSGSTPDTSYLVTGSTSNAWVLTEYFDTNFDFAHPQQPNPTFYFQSANQSTSQWGSAAHNQTDFVLASGFGAIRLAPAGHVKITGTAPAVTANCGTSPSVTGSDQAGKLNVGTGGTATTCTLTFAVAFTAAPACVANNETTTQLIRATSTTTTLVLTAAAAFTASDVLSYICLQGS
jgi:hypothetical protein